MVAQGAQADFHGQEILHKTGAAFFIQCNQKSSKILSGYAVHTSGRDGKRQLDKRISGGGPGRAEDERRKMAKKCGPLTHALLLSSSLAQRPFEFFLPAKKRGEKLMNSIKCHFRWRGEIGIVEEREGRSVFGSPR